MKKGIPRGQEHVRTCIIPVNPSDKAWTEHRFVLSFGEHRETRLLVWANSLDDALDESVDWIADNAPGHLVDDTVKERYEYLLKEEPDLTDECRWERATAETTCAGNNGHYIDSFEWDILAEDPSRAHMLALLNLPRYRDRKTERR